MRSVCHMHLGAPVSLANLTQKCLHVACQANILCHLLWQTAGGEGREQAALHCGAGTLEAAAGVPFACQIGRAHVQLGVGVGVVITVVVVVALALVAAVPLVAVAVTLVVVSVGPGDVVGHLPP